ncbi:SDR family NAD(P)-dependent oxidoreductase [Komagataeibacter rhaeticus]|uniref:SDR family oxidoreductase n=1 Tax=Komagataeibacter rhaeticus TaxID=215221 RepID=A0A181CB80_9PROT|nr:SDR family oxidoreductase [Komagataeibacter rhaeticus]ATU74262.1 oxidoreductase [Komagataeibacter xylinus]QIP35575.1 SDR family oxidoreductase [Komagataeibacter rhaeticus]QOC45330.1 SDR family oxidoreductase [Komagataeibacter rhaeticus]WPP22264.1 SDR family oxidoreductase [Komagataeibacter rhaeticus]SAY48820.1 Cyclic-di-GMP-binding biofilm dispersal mediator protein [Komagataeibacter rhaeticus]
MTQRVAYITGGSRGIGAAIAKTLAKDGFDIAISYARNEKAAEQTLEAVRALGRRGLAIRCDGEGSGNRAAIRRVVSEMGRIDALVCNAGVYPHGDVTEMTDAQVDAVLGLNVRAVMIETIEAARHMTQGGRIILIGSTFADRSPFPGISLYSASKSALNGFARGAARDLGPRGITINVVQPGPIDTDMNPATGPGADLLRSFMCHKEYGQVGDIASVVSFLASPQASFITGSALTTDGGLAA